MKEISHWMCPHPYKVGDIITTQQTIYPKWWQFWKKPYEKRITYKMIDGNTMESI